MNADYYEQNLKLTSAEISGMWSSYIFETMVHNIYTYFMNNVEDREIRAYFEYGLLRTRSYINACITVFQKENLPVPRGTTYEDVNVNAPRLYSDKFYVYFAKSMANTGMLQLASAYAGASRDDIRKLFREQLLRLEEVDQMGTELMINKGIYIRAPYVDVPNQVDFVKRESFFEGFFGSKRPLTVNEINQLFLNARSNALGKALFIGFSQVAKSKAIHEYVLKGKDLSDKYFRMFSEVLRNDDITVPPSLDSEVLPFSGTESPYSDRLILTNAVYLNAYGIGGYGTSLAQSQRHDLMAMYAKVMAEVGTYAADGANLLIENGWLEQVPTASEHKNLSTV